MDPGDRKQGGGRGAGRRARSADRERGGGRAVPGRGRVCAEEGGGPASPPRAPGLTEGAKFAGGGGWGGWGGGTSAPGMGETASRPALHQ